MRFRTLEIRWHDNKPISTCDFQPLPFKKARPAPGPGSEKNYANQAYRLATGGEDNHVRIWMVHPHLRPPAVVAESDETAAAAAPRPPRVEYLATLSRHSAPVNVVRFSPNGELIASAGDDGMIIIWAPTTNPQTATYGSDLSPEDLQHEKEHWKPRTTFRCTQMQVYDLAWSPTGEYIFAGSTDNTAKVFAAADGKCVLEIAEHLHYVQGVAWDPLNEYIATQSSDRSMHIYRIVTKPGGAFEAHAVGKNTRMPQRHSRSHSRAHSRTPSAHGGHGGVRPRFGRRESMTSDIDGSFALDTTDSEMHFGGAPLTPAASVGSSSTPAFMFPPPPIVEGSSRRSSFSSNAPGSPSPFNASASVGGGTPSMNADRARYARSPSPMPPLPAIRSGGPPSGSVSGTAGVGGSGAGTTSALWTSVKLYGDESYTNFFRRLTFSPDGGLLLTPAGQFEDPAVVVPPAGGANGKCDDGTGTPVRGRKGHPAEVDATTSVTATGGAGTAGGSSSSVYIYSRANFARPPIAQLPGHKKASVAVRFSPVLYELRPNVASAGGSANEKEKESGSGNKDNEPPSAMLELGQDGSMDVDVVGPLAGGAAAQAVDGAASSGSNSTTTTALMTPQKTPAQPSTPIATPTPKMGGNTNFNSNNLNASNPSAIVGLSSAAPAPMELRPHTPQASKPSTPAPAVHAQGSGFFLSQSGSGAASGSGTVAAPATASVFTLPYRMLFAVVTMDTVAIYDTQQAGPLCLLTKLHYDEFTDMTWSPDGQTLMLSSRDGYCTLVVFDDILPAHHTQQHTMQLQSIAHNNYVPISFPSSSSSSSHAHGFGSHAHSHSAQTTPTHSQSQLNISSSSGSVSAMTTPSMTSVGLPSTGNTNSKKRAEPPLTPAASVDGSEGGFGAAAGASATGASGSGTSTTVGLEQTPTVQEPPKKKRRVVLTRVGDLDS